jgi:hypothetical protein
MGSPSKFNCLLLVVCLVVAGLPAAVVVAQTSPVDDSHSHQQPAETRQPDSQTQHAEAQEETQEEEEEVKAAQATARQTGYSSAHVSSLLLDGKPPDLVFQKSLDTFAKRHHVRIWKMTKTYGGREVWVGAATHDIATGNSRGGTKWSHRIDPHIDRERDWVETVLLFAGTGKAYADIDRPAAPRKAANATGDDIVTDGKMSVVDLVGTKNPDGTSPPALAPRPAGKLRIHTFGRARSMPKGDCGCVEKT